MSKMQFKKEKSLWDHVMFKNQDFFYTIMEMFQRLKEGTVPVPSLYPPLRIAIVRYYLYWGSSQLGASKVAGGKPKLKHPETL